MNESEFETELRRVRPASASARLVERIAGELECGTNAISRDSVEIAAAKAGINGSALRATGTISRGSDRRGWNFWSGLAWAFGGAAAAVTILLTADVFRSKRTAVRIEPLLQPAVIAINEEPDESVAELIASEDEGLVLDAGDAGLQRQVRLTYLERHTWTNPESGAVIEVEVPREDIVWMPVAMQ
jgi:hypothetical protein